MKPTVPQHVETRARRRWLAMIIGLFVTQMSLWSIAIWKVSDDPSHAVVEDYAQKAVQWDARAELQRQSRALGWHADLALKPAETGHVRQLALQLADDTGQPVADATVTVSLFHQARAARKQSVTLIPEGPGHYTAAVPMEGAGNWRLEVEARRGEDLFLLETVRALEEG